MNVRAKHWQVGITTCHGRSFKVETDSMAEAMGHYSMYLGCAVDPNLLNPDGVLGHIRMVTLIGTDDLGEAVHHVSTPVFECDCPDRPTTAAA